MFDSDFYTEYFEGMPPPAPFKLKFIEDPNAKIKVFIGESFTLFPSDGFAFRDYDVPRALWWPR